MDYKKTLYYLLGLLMLIAGLAKLFNMGPSAIVSMLSNNAFFSWAATFWAWVLILGEILIGATILANYKAEYTKYAGYGGALIIFVALFTQVIDWATITSNAKEWNGVMMQFMAGVGYLMLAEGQLIKLRG